MSKIIKLSHILSNHLYHLPESLGRIKQVVVPKRGKVGVALLMKILVIYLIFIPCVFLIECSAGAPSDEKSPVSVSGLNQVSDSSNIGDSVRAFTAFQHQDLTIDKSNEVSPGARSQLEPVCQEAGIKTSGEADNAEADTDEEFDFGHETSVWLLCFAIGFLVGNIQPFYEISKNYRKINELNRQFEEDWPEMRRQIEENFKEQERQIQEKQNG